MSRPEDPEETKIVHALKCPLLCSIDRVCVHLLIAERILTQKLDRVGYSLYAHPIAYIIGIASPHEDLDPRLNYCGKRGEEGTCVW